MNDVTNFKAFLALKRRIKGQVNLFLDIETYQYNEANGKIKPSQFKNCTFSVACSYFNNDNQLKTVVLPSFKHFFDLIFEATLYRGNHSSKNLYNLIFHNGNKYDNHFMLKDIRYFYPDVIDTNLYLKNAVSNDLTEKMSDLDKQKKKGIILEKRVKSSNNLELIFFLKNLKFKTVDTYVKTNMSIRGLGNKLFKLGILNKDQLKTKFDYLKYNLQENLSDEQAYEYAEKIFYSLTDDEITYIKNDVIILAYVVKNYTKLFPDFDFNKITFTSNILEYYNTNDLTSFQLLNQIGNGKDKVKINFTDYFIGNQNLYDYFKSFYRGGLNFYNQKYLNEVVENMFSIDINSSYPFEMYSKLIPTFLHDYKVFEKETKIYFKDLLKDKYYLFRMTRETFNTEILINVKSKILKQILVKYYNNGDYVNINTNTLKILKDICKLELNGISILSTVSYECVEFGSREHIAKLYTIKTQGKLDKKIIMKTPMEYTITDEINKDVNTSEEVNISKVKLNGLYGIPALRAYFNLFKILPDDNLESIPNGYKNNERNLIFSIFVTSGALYNLLSPLKYLSANEIDEYFVYCDTDSLYLRKEVFNKIPSDFFDKISLGKWDIEHENITKFFVLNHKKYCFFDGKENKIELRCGGIDLDSFDLNVSFDDFISNQFYNGANVKNTKSIYNEQKTISIYESVTRIESGKNYPYMFSNIIKEKTQQLKDKIRKEFDFENDDFIYIESDLGTFSQSDIFPIENTIDNRSNLWILKAKYAKIKATYF